MARSLSHWRVVAASLFSIALIGGSYLFARSVTRPPTAEASTESALLQSIAARDSDGDGLPDWEESLYGTDPHVVDTFHLGMTDGEAVAKGLVVPRAIADIPVTSSTSTAITDQSVPKAAAAGSLTDVFAKNFFARYLTAVQGSSSGVLTQEEMQNIATDALAELAQSIVLAPDFKSASNLTISGSGSEAMRTFAVSAETILLANKANASKSEIIYLQQALQNNDTSALDHIHAIAKAYRTAAAGLAVLPVPQELVSTDLALINSMARISEITEDFARVNDDPLAAMLALQQYPQAVLDFGNAFISIKNAYAADGIILNPGEPGARFVNLITDVAEEQAAQTP